MQHNDVGLIETEIGLDQCIKRQVQPQLKQAESARCNYMINHIG